MLLLAVVAAVSGSAQQWKIEYTGDRLPEIEGPWIRSWGDWEGYKHGTGAVRTLKDGVLTMDTLYDLGVYDYCFIEPDTIDPGPNRLFVLAWRVRVEKVVGRYTADIGIISDRRMVMFFNHATDRVFSEFDESLDLPVAPGFHVYRMESRSMMIYDFYIDAQHVHSGPLWQGVGRPYLGWGEGIKGAGGLHHWDYVCVAHVDLRRMGDLNCDGTVNFADINPFIEALSDPVKYAERNPLCDVFCGDMNKDGVVDFGDIDGFVEVLMRGF